MIKSIVIAIILLAAVLYFSVRNHSDIEQSKIYQFRSSHLTVVNELIPALSSDKGRDLEEIVSELKSKNKQWKIVNAKLSKLESEYDINFIERKIIVKISLKDGGEKKLVYDFSGKCLNESSVPSGVFNGDK